MKKVIGFVLLALVLTGNTAQADEKTLEIEYVKRSSTGNYMLVGLNASHKGFVTCRGYDEYDNIIAIEKVYITNQFEEGMIPDRQHQIEKVGCAY